MDIFSQIPIISRYDVESNKLELDMPGAVTSGTNDNKKEDSSDQVKDIAKDKAKKLVQGDK